MTTPRLQLLAATRPEQFRGVAAVSEDTLALRFVTDCLDIFRYVPAWGWMRWQGTKWQRDVGKQHFHRARLIAREFSDASQSDTEARRVASAKTSAAIITFAQADPRMVVMSDSFDADRSALNTPAGIVDLRTGEIVLHDLQYVTKCTAVAPALGVYPKTWITFLSDVFDDADVIAFIKRLLGYFITGEVREQVLAFAHGAGANGKSTLLDLLLWLLGDYAIKVPSSLLMAARGERHPTEVASLAGIRLAVSNEIEEGAYWDENRLKELTGDIQLTARFMRQDFFTFDATHKHVIAGNHRPQVRSMDAAMRRRLLLVPFLAKFEGDRRDPHMLDKLKAEGPAILGWLIEGACEWRRSGLQVPTAIRAASEEYAAAMDLLGQWIEDCCETSDHGATELAAVLYSSYAQWKRCRGEQPVSQVRFSEQLQGRGFEHKRSNGSRYRGIRLTAEARLRAERIDA